MVTIMHHTARTAPVAVGKRQLIVDESTTATRLATGIEALNLSKHNASLLANVTQYLNELTKCQVRYFPAPKPLHTLQAQVFDADKIKGITQVMGQLEEPVAALPGNTTMSTRKAIFGIVPVARAFDLAAQFAVESSNVPLPFTEEQRRFDAAAVTEGQEGFQSEVHTNRVHYFRVLVGALVFLNDRETKPEVAAAIPLDGDGFDYTFPTETGGYGAGKDEFVSTLTDSDSVAAFVLPSRLCEGKAAVLGALLETRQPDVRSLTSNAIEERLVGQIQSLYHHLSSLRAHLVPVSKASLLLQLREVSLEIIVARILAIQTVVATTQGDMVVPYLRGVLNAPCQKAIVPVLIEAIFERTSHLGLFLNVAPYSFVRHPARCRDNVGSGPERRQAKQMPVLFSEQSTTATLEGFHYLLWGIVWVGLNKEVNLLRPDRQGYDSPIFFDGNLTYDLTKTSGNGTLEYPCTPGRTPYEMVLNRMDSVSAVAASVFVYRHTLSTSETQPGSRLYVEKSACEHFFQRRRGPCIPPLKREGLLPLRATPSTLRSG